jgi:hypothetical protein
MRAGSPWNWMRSRARVIHRAGARRAGTARARAHPCARCPWVARQRDPAERPLPLAEQRAHVLRHEARDRTHPARRRRARPCGCCCRSRTSPRRVAASRASPARAPRSLAVARRTYSGIGGAQRGRVLERQPRRHVAVQRVVRARLVGHTSGMTPRLTSSAAPPRRCRPARRQRPALHSRRAIQPSASSRSWSSVAVAGLQALLDARRVDLHAEDRAAVHGRGERLRPAHPAESGGEHEAAGERPAEVLAAPPRRTSRTCPARSPASRCRSTSPRSSARTSSGRPAPARESGPRWPTGPPGCCSRSARAVPTCACGTPRRACRSARAASRRPRARAASGRWRRTLPVARRLAVPP